MAAFLKRKFWPAAAKDGGDHDPSIDFSYSCSFALEYSGPPVHFSDIPQASPICIDQIPTASTIPVDGWLLNNAALPIIHPIPLRLGNKVPKASIKPILSGDENAAKLNSPFNDVKGCDDDDDDNEEEEKEDQVASLSSDDRGEDAIFESELAESPSTSSNYFSQKEEDSDHETPRHARKSSIVTFRDPDSGDIIDDEESVSEPEHHPIPVKEKVEKKSSCHRCSKGNRLTPREVCIVCDAKYCRDCVLRVMGSMPEGRKCTTCIGFRINEARRNSLGKCSKMLKRLLTEDEIKQIMTSEMSCPPNQLPPDLVFVNDEPLDEAELRLLQNCSNPPKKLRPGYYWYDRVSGFWGKDGQKPCQMITSQLGIGGTIRSNASNGNTGILINKREITKDEALMLKLAGIPCEGNPHYWVTEDGSYTEEGQKTEVGDKAILQVVVLPMPPDTVNAGGEQLPSNIDHGLLKLLLIGFENSGTSTIFKQARLLYGDPFTEEERNDIKMMIQSNLYRYMGVLLEGRERFAEESLREESRRAKGKGLMTDQCSSSGKMEAKEENLTYSIGPRLKAFSDWLLNVIESGNLEAIVFPAARDYARFVEELWTDPAIQATYSRRSELEKLPRVATYLLERAIEISKEDYVPSDMDILYAEGISSSNGLASTEYVLQNVQPDEWRDPADRRCAPSRCQLIRVHPRSLRGISKWLEMFEEVDMVLFCVSLTDYDEFILDDRGVPTNKMMASKKLFETIVTHPAFSNKDFLLVLNKFDMLEEKIEQVPLAQCEWFHEFDPVISHNHNNGVYVNPNPSSGERAFHYIAVKFKRFFSELTGRKLFVSAVTGLERDTVDECLRFAREIMNWGEAEPFMINENEISSASIEESIYTS